MRNIVKYIAAASTAVVLAASAHAATFVSDFTYNLSDHPDGSQQPNFDYGIRLDRETPDLFFTFDNGASAILQYDVSESTAILSGTVFESTGNGTTGDSYELLYTLTDVTDLGGGFFVQNTANSSGTLRNNNDGTILSLGTASNGNYFFKFADDGHRLPGNTGIAGRGWIQSGPGANDFLFTATLDPNNNVPPVPLPAAGWMLLAGLGGMAAMRRRKKAS